MDFPIDPVQLKAMLDIAKQTERILFPSSRVIRSAGYFPPLKMLEIEQRGRYYRTILQYFGAEDELLRNLILAQSKAEVYYQRIHGIYPHQELESSKSVFKEPAWGSNEPSQVRNEVHLQKQAQLWGWTR